MLRKQKEGVMEGYASALGEAGFAILIDATSVNIRIMDEFRNQLTEKGAKAIQLKNTLARIVFERSGMEAVCEILVGPSLLVCGAEDVGAAAKLVRQYQKDFRDAILPVKGIWFDGKLYPAEDFKIFAELPTKDEARSQLLGIIQEPARQIASIAMETYSRLARVLNEYSSKQQ
jgi:large subunit ribosomal protein L10